MSERKSAGGRSALGDGASEASRRPKGGSRRLVSLGRPDHDRQALRGANTRTGEAGAVAAQVAIDAGHDRRRRRKTRKPSAASRQHKNRRGRRSCSSRRDRREARQTSDEDARVVDPADPSEASRRPKGGSRRLVSLGRPDHDRQALRVANTRTGEAGAVAVQVAIDARRDKQATTQKNKPEKSGR